MHKACQEGKKMKKYIFILLLFFCGSCFAQEKDVFDYITATNGYISINNRFSVQIISSRTDQVYNVFNDLRGSVDIVAWKADKKFVTMIVRLRGWNTDKTAEYYSVIIDCRAEKPKGSSQLLSKLPDFSKYRLNPAKTNDAAINLRAESNAKSKKIGQYQKNNTVVFTGKTDNKCSINDATDYWFSIDYSGTPAWIYGKYITFAGSAAITLESLGIIKPKETKEKEFKQTSGLKLNCVSNSSEPVYNIYTKGDNLIKIERAHYYSGGISIKKGNKQITEITSHKYSVYSSKFNKLFYLTSFMDDRSFVYSIDCATGNGEQLKDKNNSKFTPYYSRIFLSSDEKRLFAVDCTYKGDDDTPYLELIEIDVKTNKILHTYISQYKPFRICEFGKLTDDIFCFITDPRSDSDAVTIKFVKIQEDELKEIDSFKLEGYESSYADEIYTFNLQKSNHVVVNTRDFENDKVYIFEYTNGKIIECSSKIKGTPESSFYQNDKEYLLTVEKKTRTIHLYDSELNELLSEYYKDCAEPGFYFSKAGFDNSGNITVVFEWSK